MQLSTFQNQTSPAKTKKTAGSVTSGLTERVLTQVSNLWRRHKLVSLEKLDDHMLDDIGVNRLDLQWARLLPLDRNPLAALDELARKRSRARRLSFGRRLPGSRPL